MTDLAKFAAENLEKVRKKKPLVHSITNFVAMTPTANALLALGASPFMSHILEEMEDVSAISNALVINIGTLSKPWIQSMNAAARLSRILSKPYVLDPVGSGATRFRTQTAQELIRYAPPTVIRGNASEVMSLSSKGGQTRGVDAIHSVEDAIGPANEVSRALGSVIAVTGQKDVVTDGYRSFVVSGGSPMMTTVTATGCTASVIVGAFLAVEKDAVLSAASALAVFKLVAERAADGAKGPGSYWMNVIDQLHSITAFEVERNARIELI